MIKSSDRVYRFVFLLLSLESDGLLTPKSSLMKTISSGMSPDLIEKLLPSKFHNWNKRNSELNAIVDLK